MSRKKKILQYIDKNKWGVEIGPSYNPVAPKKKGYKVHIIDYLNRDELIKKYNGHGIDTSKIEDVDFVWRGEKLTDIIGKSKHYDWIIASQVIEHTPDLVAFINDCASILKDDGVLSLAVPDKRYCFDHYRSTTKISEVIDHHFQETRIHSPGTVVDHHINAVSKAGRIAWEPNTAGEYSFVHSLDDTLRFMKLVVKDQTYFDIHAWNFVPHSFRLLIHDLYHLGLISLKEVTFHPTSGTEFYVTLGKNGRGIKKSRMKMLDIIESEIICHQSLFSKLGIKNLIYRLIRYVF